MIKTSHTRLDLDIWSTITWSKHHTQDRTSIFDVLLHDQNIIHKNGPLYLIHYYMIKTSHTRSDLDIWSTSTWSKHHTHDRTSIFDVLLDYQNIIHHHTIVSLYLPCLSLAVSLKYELLLRIAHIYKLRVSITTFSDAKITVLGPLIHNYCTKRDQSQWGVIKQWRSRWKCESIQNYFTSQDS